MLLIAYSLSQKNLINKSINIESNSPVSTFQKKSVSCYTINQLLHCYYQKPQISFQKTQPSASRLHSVCVVCDHKWAYTCSVSTPQVIRATNAFQDQKGSNVDIRNVITFHIQTHSYSKWSLMLSLCVILTIKEKHHNLTCSECSLGCKY